MRSGRNRWWLVAAVGLVLAGPAVAADQVETYLDNGLRVLVRVRPLQSLVAVDVIYAAGAAAEPDSLGGLARLTEHLLHVGEPRRRLALVTVDAGASTGTTSMDFHSRCLPSMLPRVLDVEADRMRTARVDTAGFARERSVVLEELALRSGDVDNSPAALAFRAAFPGHPYGRSVGGTRASVSAIGPADVRRFVSRTIRPDAAILTIDGPVDPDTVLAQVRECFGAIASGAEADPLPPYPPATREQAIVDAPDHEGVEVAVAVRVPMEDARAMVDVDLASAYLRYAGVAVGLTLIPGEAVVTADYFVPYYRPDEEMADLYPFNPDRDVQAFLGRFWERVDRARRDLAFGQPRAEAEAWLSRQAAARRVPRGDTWLPGRVFSGEAATVTDSAYAALAATVTVDSLYAFLGERLLAAPASIGVGHGSDSGRLKATSLAGRVEREDAIEAADALGGLTAADLAPVLAAYADAGVLPLVRFELANGVPVVCRTVPDDPDWSLRGWRRLDPLKEARPGHGAGLCQLYARTLPYDPRTAPEGRRPKAWPHGAQFTLQSGGLFGYRASGPCDEAAAVAGDLVRRLDEDRFNISAWESAMSVGEIAFARQNVAAASRAAAWRWSRVLGRDHPAVGGLAPEAKTARDAQYKDLEKLHKRVAGSTGATMLLAAGGLDPEAVRSVLEPTFGKRGRYDAWSAPQPPAGPAGIEGTIVPSPVDADVQLTLTFAPRLPAPGTAQPGLRLLLMEEALEQALDRRLRQREGWTYGAWCRVAVVGGWALPEIAVTCQPGQAPEVLDRVREVLADLAAAPDPDLMALARLRLVKRLLAAADDPGNLADLLMTVSAFGPRARRSGGRGGGPGHEGGRQRAGEARAGRPVRVQRDGGHPGGRPRAVPLLRRAAPSSPSRSRPR